MKPSKRCLIYNSNYHSIWYGVQYRQCRSSKLSALSSAPPSGALKLLGAMMICSKTSMWLKFYSPTCSHGYHLIVPNQNLALWMFMFLNLPLYKRYDIKLQRLLIYIYGFIVICLTHSTYMFNMYNFRVSLSGFEDKVTPIILS